MIASLLVVMSPVVAQSSGPYLSGYNGAIAQAKSDNSANLDVNQSNTCIEEYNKGFNIVSKTSRFGFNE